jgi:hypothetical protein
MIPGIPEHLMHRRERPLDATRSNQPFRLFVDLDTLTEGPLRSLVVQLARQRSQVEVVVPADSKSVGPDVLSECTVVEAVTDGPADSWYGSSSAVGRRGQHAIYSGRTIEKAARVVAAVDRPAWIQRHAVLAAGVAYCDAATTQFSTKADEQLFLQLGLMKPEAALGLLGLWMTQRSQIQIPDRRFGLVNTSPEFLRWLTARGALPEAWRYVGACSSASSTVGDRPRDLALSTITRLSRALRARNEVHSGLWGVKGSNTFDDLPFWFDAFLLLVSAAYDSLARATYVIYGMGSDPARQNWGKLGNRSDEFPAEFSDVAWGPLGNIRPLVGFLRNSIHEEPLIGVGGSGGAMRSTIHLSDHAADEFLRLAELAGATAEDGIRTSGGIAAIEPGPFVEMVTRRVFQHLNAIMGVTDFGQLGVEALDVPPTEDDDTFAPSTIAGALILGGLGELTAPVLDG